MANETKKGEEGRNLLPPRSEHDARLRKSINLTVGLLRFRDNNPPANSALGRGARDEAICGIAAEKGEDGLLSLASWCSLFVDSINRCLGDSGRFLFRADIEPRISFELAHCIALTVGELLVDALERAFYAGKPPRIALALESEGPERLQLRITDSLPSFRLPPTAVHLAATMQAELHDNEGADSTERILVFDPAS